MMENKREKQNARILEMLWDMVNSGAIKDETSALIYIGGFLGDISKSLSIIADSLNASKPYGTEPRWIPCSEKLPERGVSVLLSHVGYVSEDYLDIDDGAMYFWNSGIDLDEELNNLAWMPLPEPWKGEEDE